MITKKVQSALKNFLQLNEQQRADVLHKKGLLLDSDVENNNRVNLFYLNGFFVEEILNYLTWELKETIPYKSGFRLESYLNKNNHFLDNGDFRQVG